MSSFLGEKKRGESSAEVVEIDVQRASTLLGLSDRRGQWEKKKVG